MIASGHGNLQPTLMDASAVRNVAVVRVCIADEDELLLAGSTQLLSQSPAIEVVRSTLTRYSLGDATWLLAPNADVYVLGMDTLSERVIDALNLAGAAHGRRGVVLLANEIDDGLGETLASFMRAWTAGFACLFKRTIDSSRKLMGVIESVVDGRTTAEAAVMKKLLGRDDSGTWIDQLSQRELQVLKLMAAGYSNPAIGAEMHLETKTIERHINGIYGKFGDQGASGHLRVQAVTAYLAGGR